MDYKQILRNKLLEEIGKIDLDSGISIKPKLDEKVCSLIKNKLKGEIEKDEKILDGFCNEEYRKILKNKPALVATNKLSVSDNEFIIDFLVRKKGGNKISLDYYSLCVGSYGYLAFQEKCIEEARKNELKVIGNDEFHPMKKTAIQEFFKYPCHTYCYDEDLTKETEGTDPKFFHYPNIDALVLEHTDNVFTLKNVPTDKNAKDGDKEKKKKEDHELGIISWCKSSFESTDDNNSFDIVFKKSRTKLILRIHFPYENYNDGEDFDFMLGAFLFASKKGSIAVGTVLIERNKENKEIFPYKYEFKKGKEGNTPEPREEIQNYLYDRYRNWIKIKYNYKSFAQLKKWQKEKDKDDYTKNTIKIFDYLISYPHRSIGKEEEERLEKTIELFFNNPQIALRKSTLESEDKEILAKYIKEKWEKGKFRIYPPSRKVRKDNVNFNKNFFRELKKTVNAIFIIPNATYLQTSSVFTVIGYCIALKKRTFVFFEEGMVRPNILKNREPNVNLYIHPYKNIMDIPELIIENELSEEWKMIKKRYD